MATQLLPVDALGAVEKNGVVTFGVFLPWVSAADGNRVSVRVIHEDDQFLQGIAAREFPMAFADRDPYGAHWSVTVPIAGTPSNGSSWGSPGRYVYRYCVQNPAAGEVDFVIDPVSREYGAGKQSAFTLGATPYVFSDAETAFRTPALADLVFYELDIAEFGGNLDRALQMLRYLSDLGVNAVEVMPLSNVAGLVDWGYLPIGYFGVSERFGKRTDFQKFVDTAHQNGIAVVLDMVFGHAGVDFPYYDLYTRLGYRENPFMGPFAKDYFSAEGKSTDFNRQLTRDYFHTVIHHWLEEFHVDGFRYDCVPNWWDGPTGVGYANTVYEAYQLVKARLGSWTRFDGGNGEVRFIQCAEQLEGPGEVLTGSYSTCTWQNGTFEAARAVARGDFGRIADFGMQLGPSYCPESVTTNGELLHKRVLQYIENHDHERFICNFGLGPADDTLFRAGDRSQWFKVQPYLIAVLLSRGIPMLWEGEELCENYFLPDQGQGRVALLRPVRWDYFYGGEGRSTIALVRELLRLRKSADQFRSGEHFFFNDWDRYAQKGVLAYARWTDNGYSLVAVNFGDQDRTVSFWFPIAGDYREELHGGALDLHGVGALTETQLVIPSNYGRIWTHV